MVRFSITNVARRPALGAVIRYGLSVACVAAALGLSLILAHYHLPRLFGVFSLAASAIVFWYAGTGPGLLAVLLSSLALGFVVFPISEIRGPGWQSFLSIYAIFGGLVGWFTASRRRAERLLAEARDNLERRVAQRTRELAQANEELQMEVNERKRAEEELRVSEAKFRAQTETAPVAIYIIQGSRFLYANPAMEAMTGYSHEELLAMNFWEVVHPDFRQLVKERGLARQRGEAVPARYEFKILTKGGEERWVDFSDGKFQLEGKLAIVAMAFDITERKRAEEAMRQSEQRYKDFLSHSHEGVWRLELVPPVPISLAEEEVVERFLESAYLAECNPAFARNIGQSTPEELVGKRLRDLVLPSDLERIASFRSACRGGWQNRTIEYRGLDLSGDLKDLVRTEIPIVENGMLVRIWGITRDVTGLKRAEEALRQSEARFRSFFELPLIGNAITTPEKGWIAVNDRICDLLGYSPQEFTQMSWVAMTHPDDLAAELTEFNRVLAGEIDGYSLVKRCIRKDGQTIWGRVAVRCMRKPEGAVDYFCAIMEDITEGRRAEESLRESEERFRTTFENAGIGMALVDMQGHPVKCNPALQKMLGYSEKELTSLVFTEFTHPDDRDQDMSLYRELAAGNSEKYNIEKRYITKDGSVRWGLLIVSLVRGIDGAPAYAVGMVEDITERKRATEELRRSLDQLRALAARLQSAREEERTRVAREIHDELGSGLTAIKIDLSSLVQDLPPEKRQEYSSILKEVGETIQSVRRICTELRPAVLDTLGPVAAVEWAAEEFQERTGIKCRLDLPQDEVAIDRECATALFRIFQETLTNVTRHANATELDVRLAKENGHLLLEIHDNGKGISDEQICKGGSLGILGMRERVLLLGGDLTIGGAPGRGTTVRLRIPQHLPP